MRIESSIITSLSELRAIEQQRIAEERAVLERDRVAVIEAARASERARVEAEQARVRAEREERMRIETTRLDAEREARMRVEAHAAGERARLAAQLEERRLAEEIELRRAEVAKKRPTWMLVVTGIAALAAVGLTLFAIDSAQSSNAARAAEHQALVDKERARQELRETQQRMSALQGDIDKFDATLTKLQDRLLVAQNKADRDALAKEIADAATAKRETQRKLAVEQAAREHAGRIKPIDVTGCTDTAVGCLDHH